MHRDQGKNYAGTRKEIDVAKCNPMAKEHGFDRNASHTAGEYVCVCETNQEEAAMSELIDDLRKELGELTYSFDGRKNMHEILSRYESRISELESQARWIPVSERLPEVCGIYLLGTIYHTSVRSFALGIWEDEWLTDDVDESEEITHWRHIEPPKEQHSISPELDKAAADLMSLSIRGRQ